MKYLVLFAIALGFFACAKPHPYNKVRTLRHQYKLDVDLTVSKEGKATYIVKAKNLSGEAELQEVTAIVRIFDKDEKLIWSKQVEVPVLGIGNNGTAEQQFSDEIGSLEVDSFDVIIAPDEKDDPFESYTEYRRVVPVKTK